MLRGPTCWHRLAQRLWACYASQLAHPFHRKQNDKLHSLEAPTIMALDSSHRFH